MVGMHLLAVQNVAKGKDLNGILTCCWWRCAWAHPRLEGDGIPEYCRGLPVQYEEQKSKVGKINQKKQEEPSCSILRFYY
jgi:hypothetical protein